MTKTELDHLFENWKDDYGTRVNLPTILVSYRTYLALAYLWMTPNKRGVRYGMV